MKEYSKEPRVEEFVTKILIKYETLAIQEMNHTFVQRITFLLSFQKSTTSNIVHFNTPNFIQSQSQPSQSHPSHV